MDQRNSSRKAQPVPAATILMAALIMGIALIISAAVIGSAVGKLTAAMENQTFAYDNPSFSTVNVKSSAQKTYFTAAEAAEYLKIPESEITAAITKGEITSYVRTSEGYSISRTALDNYFEDKAYSQIMSNNSEESE